jgi:hypothetical protein
LSLFSIREAQEAQVMPPIASSIWVGAIRRGRAVDVICAALLDEVFV